MRHVRLELRLDPRVARIEGRATLRLAPLHDGFRTLELDLGSELHVAAVRTGERRLRFVHRDDRLRIDLGRAAPGGRDLEVEIDYAGTPRRGLYFVGPDAARPHVPHQAWTQGQDEDSKHWFPCYDSPNDKATSEILATVPEPYVAVSNGRFLGVRADGRRRRRTFHWHETFPHPAYLVSLVVGEFAVERETVGGVTLEYWVPKRDAEKSHRTFASTPAMLRFFSKAIDYPYPYEKYAQVVVHDFVFGGMENLTATTLTDAVLLDATAALDFRSDSLLAHELAHQWWGNLVTCKEWSHAWLNEGFATYFDALFTEHHRGRDEFFWQMHENARDYFLEDEEKYRRPIVERRWTKPIEIFDRHLYEKGALVLHLLRHELGDDLFWKSIRHYARKHQFQNVESADLKVAIEEATGSSMDRFFDQWVLGTGFPIVSASWTWLADASALRLVVRQVQGGDGGTSPFAFPLEVEIGAPGGTRRHRLRVEAAEHTFHLPCPREPRWVRVDPEHRVPMKLQIDPGRDALLAQLDCKTDWFAAADAARGLGRAVGDADVRTALTDALGEPRFFAAKRAIAAALAAVGGPQSRDALIARLGDRDLRARRGIARALGEFKADATAAAALRRAWKTEKSYFVRAEIVAALARIGAPDTFEFLVRALDVDSFRDAIRAAALRGLAELEDERGIDAALQWIPPGPSRWTRDAAMRSAALLARLYPRRGRSVQDALERVLAEGTFFAVLSAVDALGKLGRPQGLAALRRVAAADIDGRLQKAAREAGDALVAGAQPPEALRALRAQIDSLQGENRVLRSRLERLETQLDLRQNGAKPQRSATSVQRRPGRKRTG